MMYSVAAFYSVPAQVISAAHPHTHLRGFIVASCDEAIALRIKESHARYVAPVSIDRAHQELVGLELHSRLTVARVRHRSAVCLEGKGLLPSAVASSH